jgi:hypothetical protein
MTGGFCVAHGGSRPKCKHPDGCEKEAKKGGFCIAHGGTKLKVGCRFPGCEKWAATGGFCVAHGGGTKCKHPDGCLSQAKKGGLCRAHGDAIIQASVKRKLQQLHPGDDDFDAQADTNAVALFLTTIPEKFELGMKNEKPSNAAIAHASARASAYANSHAHSIDSEGAARAKARRRDANFHSSVAAAATNGKGSEASEPEDEASLLFDRSKCKHAHEGEGGLIDTCERYALRGGYCLEHFPSPPGGGNTHSDAHHDQKQSLVSLSLPHPSAHSQALAI